MENLALGYTRTSSYKQLDNNSIEIQKQHIKEFAHRNQLLIPDEYIFVEDATSAHSKPASKRKVLMQLADKMIELGIGTVIFNDTSRMDRTGYSFVKDFYRPLYEKIPHLEVYTTDSDTPIDPDSPKIQMQFLLDQYESEIKSERAVAHLTGILKEETPKRPGSVIPYGYNQVEKKLYPNEDAEIVTFIHYLHSWGYSTDKIALLLNDANIPSPKNKLWRSSSVYNIIKNPVYYGNLTWNVPKSKDEQNKFFYGNSHTAIVEDYFDQLHKLNEKLYKEFGRFDTSFIFLKKIKCTQCKNVLSTQNGTTTRNGNKYEYLYYVCRECNFKVDAKEFEKILIPEIMAKVQSLVLNENFKKVTLELLVQMVTVSKDSIQTKNKEIQVLTQKLEECKQAEDYELERIISSKIERSFNEIHTLDSCISDLGNLFNSVNQNQFFSRFQNILTNEMSGFEKRLIILYFIDFIEISINKNFNIHYKANIFRELLI